MVSDQLSDEYYDTSQKTIGEIIDLISTDFSNFDVLSSISLKLNFQENYLNDLRMVSYLYRKQVEEQYFYRSVLIEVVYSHTKTMILYFSDRSKRLY